MHSRIFQVSSSPIKKEDYIEEYRYEDYFVPSHADYVVEQTDKESIKSDLEWLSNHNGIVVDIGKKTITITSKEEFFTEKHDKFKELAGQLSNISLEDFISDKKYFDFYELKELYDDQHGFYIDDNDEYMGYASLDHWIRNAEEGKVYYIGAIFDYHF